MSDFAWHIHRLRRMPPVELPYRLEQFLKKKLDKYSARASRQDCRKYSQNIHKVDMAGAEAVFPDLRMHVVNSAENILNHHFQVFGIERDFVNLIGWHLDPKTGNQWPLVFWGDIDYRDGETVGGIKFAWELNRLHHLPLLGMAFRITQDRKYKDEVFLQLRSWMDNNPYPNGINWISGIEIGIRLVNLVYSLKFLAGESLARGEQELLTEFVSLSGRHLYRYRSKYSSCANHAVAEALGMFVAGLSFPHIEGAAKWKKSGKSVLEREITRQIHPDGSSFEHSVPYLLFVSEHFLVYLSLCREHCEPHGAHVGERLKASLEFISSIVDINGNFPFIGDGDDGILLKFGTTSQDHLYSLLNTGAILFDNPSWILEDAYYDLKTFCLLGGDSRGDWELLRERTNRRNSGVQHFPDAGIVTIRDKYDSLFVGNGGRLGLEPLGGHGHADALSFWLSVDGHPIIVDPGTYLYHSGGKWRTYFRSTSAHSTIRVDGQDQAPILSDFMFGSFYSIKDVQLEESNERVVWSAEHDGYTRLEDPVIHKRRITCFKNNGEFIIDDLLSCRGMHSVESLVHFHPNCRVSLSDHVVIVGSGEAKLTLELDQKWGSLQIISGQNDPILGWCSPSFNVIQRSYTLACQKNIDGTETFRSVIRLKS
jgi:hypothetical protein